MEVAMGASRPLIILLVGFLLVLAGFVGPVLMVLGLVPASLALSFASHTASVGGLFLGLLGSAMYVGGRQR